MNSKCFFLFFCLLLLTSCTTGRLEYLNHEGERKVACETEYRWAPSVDKYAVEYILVHCAKKAVEKGYQVINKQLLEIDTSLPKLINGQKWTFELATEQFEKGLLTDKEYGYLIAYIDLQ